MAITPYDQASWSQYTPLTGQEILQPALLQRERHDKLDEEYAAINDMSQQIAFIAENETDPRVKQRYQNYMNQLQGGMETLMDRGVTPNSRREMLNLRSKFQSDLVPLKQGYEMKLQDMNIYNQMMMKDPTWRGPSPANRSVMDYVNNGLQPFAQTGYSGEALYQQASEMAKPYSQILNSNNPEKLMVDQFGAQYLNFKHGYGPEDDEAKIAMDFITETIMNANAPSLDWARDNQGNLNPNEEMYAKQHIKRAITQMIGKDNMVGNKMWEHLSSEDRQIKAEKRAEERAANEAAAKGTPTPKGLSWTANPRQIVRNDERKMETVVKDIDALMTGAASVTNSSNKEAVISELLSDVIPKQFAPRDAKKIQENVEAQRGKLSKVFDSIISGQITEKEFRDELASISGDKRANSALINNFIRDFTESPDAAYKEWVTANPGKNPNEFKNAYMDDYVAKRYLGNTSWKPLSTATESYFDNIADNALAHMGNREDVIVRDSEGKKLSSKEVSKIKNLQSKSNTTSAGFNWNNPDTKGVTMDYTYVDDNNKTINVSIPLSGNDKFNEITSGYREILKVINSPYSSNRGIDYYNPDTKEMERIFIRKRIGEGYYLEQDGMEIPLEQLEKNMMDDLDAALADGSLSITQLQKGG